MPDELKRLVEAARRTTMSNAEREEQRRSFANGNTAYENPTITREMVDQEAKKMALQGSRDKPAR